MPVPGAPNRLLPPAGLIIGGGAIPAPGAANRLLPPAALMIGDGATPVPGPAPGEPIRVPSSIAEPILTGRALPARARTLPSARSIFALKSESSTSIDQRKLPKSDESAMIVYTPAIAMSAGSSGGRLISIDPAAPPEKPRLPRMP